MSALVSPPRPLLQPILDRPPAALMPHGSGLVQGVRPTLSPTPLPQRLILLIENNTWILEALGQVLTMERYCCALAKNGQQARSWLALRSPSLVIMSWRLSDASAAELVSAIREHRGARVPILVLSAVEDAQAAQDAGADAFLRKPWFAKDLAIMVRELLC